MDDIDEQRSYWDKKSEIYDSLYTTEWSLNEDSQIAEALKTIFSLEDSLSILDLGCGTGLGYEMIGRQHKYVGLDISYGMLRKFKQKHPNANVVCATANASARLFASNYFDFVISLNTAMSFFGNSKLTAEAVHAILKPGGIAFLSFLNRYSLRRFLRMQYDSTEIYNTRNSSSDAGFTSANTVSEGDLLSIYSDAGFRIDGFYYQSVLGGVAEKSNLIRLEKILSSRFGFLGHAINIVVCKI